MNEKCVFFKNNKNITIQTNMSNVFFFIAKIEKINEIKSWNLKIINFEHNHIVNNILNAHFVLKRFAIISKIRNEIIRQLIIQIVFFKILVAMRINDFIVVNSMFIARNVYNFQTWFRRDELKFLIFIQILIREFEKNDWMYEFQKKKKINWLIFFSFETFVKKFWN